MSQYIYNETGDERIWEDMPEPKFPKGAFIIEAWRNVINAYNSRPSYPVSDELKKIWVKGQRVEDGKDFSLAETCIPGKGFIDEWSHIAIPLS